MITQEDVDAFSIVNVTPMEYSYWVEGKIMTERLRSFGRGWRDC